MIGEYLRTKLMDHAFGRITFTPASTLYAHLYTFRPNIFGVGGTEVSTSDWTNYAAVPITNNKTNFSDATTDQNDRTIIINESIINFGQATLVSGNIDISAVALLDNSGNFYYLWYNSVEITNNDDVYISIGNATIRIGE